MAKISVVIATYNRQVELARLLIKLFEQSETPEIVICDDGTNPSLLLELPLVYKYLWTRHEGYQRVARFNEGMAAIRTRYAILLDDDQLPLSRDFCAEYLEQLTHWDIVRGLGQDPQTGLCHLPPWFSTANLGITRLAWRKLGGIDSAYNGRYGYEDLDFGKAVEQAGFAVETGGPGTCCLHLGTPYSGERDPDGINERYYKVKWGIGPGD